MTEWIVTSCVLILIVTGLRFALKGRIGLRLQYSLWLFVLLRLLIPFSIPSPLSIMNVMPEPVTHQPTLNIQTAPAQMPEALPQLQQSAEEIPELPISTVGDTSIPSAAVLPWIWIAGMGVTFLVLTVSNLHFALRLKRSRIPVRISGCPLPVYRTNLVATPCLCGILRPKIYLTRDDTQEQSLNHILTHELSHFKHLDPIWSVLRCICLVLHWYNPLVWMAAILSKQDAELACDEAAIEKLGEDQRADYGQTLIGMTCVKRDLNTLFLTATMVGSKKALKERIRLIVKHPKTPFYTLILIILSVTIAAGCTFTGAQTPSTQSDALKEKPILDPFSKTPLSYNPEPFYMDDGLQACFVNAEGTVYIWDCLYNSDITEDILSAHITYLGEIVRNDPYTMPEESLVACRLPVGTKLYKGSDIYGNYRSDILYCQPCPGSDDPQSFGRFIPEEDIRGNDRWWEKESITGVTLTVDKLNALVEEGDGLLYSADFEDYAQIRFGNISDYRILPLEDGYRLLLVFHPNPEVELLHARLYHVESPEKYIDPLTQSIHDFLERQ